MVMQEVDKIKETFLLNRGAYDDPIKMVTRATPKAVMAFSPKFPQNRLGLAQWLFDEQNPLTSRVIVNRFWQLFFGKGLVATPEDFGNQGALPNPPGIIGLVVYLLTRFGLGYEKAGQINSIILNLSARCFLKPRSIKQRPG